MSSPYVSPLLPPQPLEVRSRNIDRQFIPAAIAIIMLALVALPNASGRVTVKTVNQYAPGSPGPTTMSLVCLKLDQEELVLPGTVVTANGSSSAVQQSYTTAMRILAYDPWGQREPLMESTNTFAPQAPQATVIYNGFPGYPGYHSFG